MAATFVAEAARQDVQESKELVKRSATLMLGGDHVSLVLGSPDPGREYERSLVSVFVRASL